MSDKPDLGNREADVVVRASVDLVLLSLQSIVGVSQSQRLLRVVVCRMGQNCNRDSCLVHVLDLVEEYARSLQLDFTIQPHLVFADV